MASIGISVASTVVKPASWPRLPSGRSDVIDLVKELGPTL